MANTFNDGDVLTQAGLQRPYLIVKDFGAVGDGVTDDRAAIQAALDACRVAGGGVVYAPPGTYLLHCTAHPLNGAYQVALVVGANTILRGAGEGATIFKMAASQPDGAYFMMNYGFPSGYVDKNIAFEDFRLDGNAANQSGNRQDGILIYLARNIHFNRVAIKNVYGTLSGAPGEGMHFDNGACIDVFYEACTAYCDAGSTSTGFSSLSSTNVHYNDCIAYGMGHGQGFTASDCWQVIYTNCHSYLNYNIDFNVEISESIVYDGCVAGGRQNDNTQWYPALTNFGTALVGFQLSSSAKVIVRACGARGNPKGVQVSNASGLVTIDGDFSACTAPYTVDTPSLPYTTIRQPIGFAADRNGSNQVIPHQAWTKVNFTHEVSDPDSYYDTANKRFLPLIPGYYTFNLSGRYQTSEAGIEYLVSIWKNGAEMYRSSVIAASTGFVVPSFASPPIFLNGSTDYIEAWTYHGSVADKTLDGGTSWTFFGGEKAR